MAKSTLTVHKKKMGRPATGHDPSVTVRIPAAVLEAAVQWGEIEGLSRAKAIARLVEIGLASLSKKKGKS